MRALQIHYNCAVPPDLGPKLKLLYAVFFACCAASLRYALHLHRQNQNWR
jgi:hypothetical protein